MRENLTVEELPMQINDWELRLLYGKEISLVKVVWGGSAGGSITQELKIHMRESYQTLFLLGNFQGKKFVKRGRVVTPQNLIKLFDHIISYFI